MSEGIRIKKGLSINIKGVAEKELKKVPLSNQLALILDDFHLVVPKLILKEGDTVKRGQPIFYSKSNERIKFVSPASGIIEKIYRGDRRKILEIIIKTNKDDNSIKHKIPALEKLNSSNIISFLLDSGCWPLIKQRPFDVIANPEALPKSIFISCFDSAPLGVDFEFILKDQIESFRYGLEVLKKITSGNLNIGLSEDQKFLHSELNDFNKNIFSGPHPAGNVGIHIHHLDPISQGESVWVLKPEDVCIIGNLFKTGEYNASRTVAVSGPPVKNPMYFKTTIGTKLSTILKSIEFDNHDEFRIINGDVLSGRKVDKDSYLGFYNNNISVLREGNNYKLFGWIPFINNNVPSIYKSSFGWLTSSRAKDYDTNLNGEERAFVITGEMEKFFPMDIYPMQLIKECMTGNIEKMERLGIYEVAPEDFGLIDYASSSKIEAQSIVRDGLDYLIKETL